MISRFNINMAYARTNEHEEFFRLSLASIKQCTGYIIIRVRYLSRNNNLYLLFVEEEFSVKCCSNAGGLLRADHLCVLDLKTVIKFNKQLPA